MCPTNFSNYAQCSTSPMGKFSLQFSVTKYRLDGMQTKFLPFLNTTFYFISVRSIRVVLFFNMKISSSFIYTWACRLGDIVAFSRYWNFSEKQYVVLELSRSIFGSQVNCIVGETVVWPHLHLATINWSWRTLWMLLSIRRRIFFLRNLACILNNHWSNQDIEIPLTTYIGEFYMDGDITEYLETMNTHKYLSFAFSCHIPAPVIS